MSKFSANVRLPFNTDDLLDIAQYSSNLKELGHFEYDISKFDKRIVELLAECDITISHTEVFYTPAQKSLAIHVDGAKLSNITKLNWVWGGEGSRMLWWKPMDQSAMKIGTTPVGTPYLYADQKKCTMIESTKIGRPTLVNVGVPHSVLNMSNSGRWCLSAVLAVNGVNAEWDVLTEKLSRFLC
jgi:hypothetical protein